MGRADSAWRSLPASAGPNTSLLAAYCVEALEEMSHRNIWKEDAERQQRGVTHALTPPAIVGGPFSARGLLRRGAFLAPGRLFRRRASVGPGGPFTGAKALYEKL